MGNRKKDAAFTLLEVLVVVTILGILAAMTGAPILTMVSEKRDEAGVLGLWSYLNNSRTIVGLYDAPFVLTFDTTANKVVAYTDTINNGGLTSTEKLRSQPLSNKLVFGLPIPKPTAEPVSTKLTTISESWRVLGLQVQNSATFSINPGHVYFKNRARPSVGYCILVRPGSSQIELFKWDGSKWYKM